MSAADYCVSSYGTIQNAVNAAGDGDKVLVPATTYQENLVITRNIVLQGGWDNGCTTRVTTDPTNTVIDGDASGSVISITSNSTATIEALTITNGQSNKGGGA